MKFQTRPNVALDRIRQAVAAELPRGVALAEAERAGLALRGGRAEYDQRGAARPGATARPSYYGAARIPAAFRCVNWTFTPVRRPWLE